MGPATATSSSTSRYRAASATSTPTRLDLAMWGRTPTRHSGRDRIWDSSRLAREMPGTVSSHTTTRHRATSSINPHISYDRPQSTTTGPCPARAKPPDTSAISRRSGRLPPPTPHDRIRTPSHTGSRDARDRESGNDSSRRRSCQRAPVSCSTPTSTSRPPPSRSASTSTHPVRPSPHSTRDTIAHNELTPMPPDAPTTGTT